MTRRVKIFQTLANRENPDEVETHGSFKCAAANAWMGEGYYFWEAFIKHAHWWGKISYGSNYFICQSIIQYDPERIFDLVGDTNALAEIQNVSSLLSKKKLPCTVAGAIEFLKRHTTDFLEKYVAVRARDERNTESRDRLFFTDSRKEYVNLSPLIQLCFFDKSVPREGGFRIIFPVDYVNVGENFLAI